MTNVGDDTFAISMSGLAVVDGEPVSVSLTVHSGLGEAVNKLNPLSAVSGPYVELVDGISIISNPIAQRVDVDGGSTSYVVDEASTNSLGSVASLGSLEIVSINGNSSDLVFDQSGSLHTLADSVLGSSTLRISGKFDVGTYYLDTNVGCPLSDSPPASAGSGALTLADDDRTTTLSVLETNPWLCHVSYGVSVISASSYDVDIDFDAAVGSSKHADGISSFGTVTLSDPSDPSDLCSFGVPVLSADSMLNFSKQLYFANPRSNLNQQTFVRLSNFNEGIATVEIYATDDSGQASRKGPLTLSLEGRSSIQLTAQDLEDGNLEKGLSGDLCDGEGKWRLEVLSDLELDVVGLIRTPDGFLTGMSAAAPVVGGSSVAYFVNPASNLNQQSFIRISNLGSTVANVSIEGADDAGVNGETVVTLDLQPLESKQVTAHDLENGNPDKGLTGAFGDGSGKWRLNVSSEAEIAVMSLIRSSDGFLTNLSSLVPEKETKHSLYYVNPASELAQQRFIRVINASGQEGTVTVSGIDDSGAIAPGGDVLFTLGADASKQMTIQDLESGNLEKGLLGSLGDGMGLWRLEIFSDVEIKVMNLIRTSDGFLTNLGDVVPDSDQINRVFFFNPGSNTNQQSFLRIVNPSDQAATVSISGVDDSGNEAPGGNVTLELLPQSGRLISSEQLETGGLDLGLTGALGDGSGKWRLEVSSSVDLHVQSILKTSNDFITNLSSSAKAL